MTPEIHKKFSDLEMISSAVLPVLVLYRHFGLDNFVNMARHYADGTMTPIAVHHMSIGEERTSRENLAHAIEVAKTIDRLCKLLIRPDGKKEQEQHKTPPPIPLFND